MGADPHDSPMASRWRTRGLRTRQRILEAIGAAIQQHGLRGLRLADIAEEVGFKPPAFYQYFTDSTRRSSPCAPRPVTSSPASRSIRRVGRGPPARHTALRRAVLRLLGRAPPLLTARHVAIMSGDRRYQAAANDAFARRRRVAGADRSGPARRPSRRQPAPVALGAVLNLMIDVAGMAAPTLNPYWGAKDDRELVDAVSYVFDRVLGSSWTRAERQPAGRFRNHTGSSTRCVLFHPSAVRTNSWW